MKTISLKFLRILFICTIALFAVTTMLISIILSSNQSTAWAIEKINQYNVGISMQYQQGNLLDGISLAELHYHDEANTIAIYQLSASMDYSCFIKAAFCLQNVTAQNIEVTLKEDSKKPKETEKKWFSLPTLRLPFTFMLKDLSIENLSLKRGQLHEKLSNISVQASMSTSKITIQHLQAQYDTIKIRASGKLRSYKSYPLDFIVNIEDKNRQLHTHIKAKGDLKKLHLQANNRGIYDITAEAVLVNILNDLTLNINLQSHKKIHTVIDNNQFILLPLKAQLNGNLETLNLSSKDATLTWLQTDKDNKETQKINVTSKLQAQWQAKTQQLSVSNFDAISDIANVKLNVLLDLSHKTIQSWSLNAHISTFDLAKLTDNEQLKSQLAANLKLQGQLSNYDISSLIIKGRLSQGQGIINEQPVEYTTAFSYDPKQWLQIESIELSSKSNVLTAKGNLNTKSPLLMHIDFKDISHFYPPASGQLQGNVKLYSRLNIQSIDNTNTLNQWINKLHASSSLNVKTFKYETLQFENMALELDINELGNAHSYFHLKANNLTINEQLLPHLKANINGQQSLHQIHIDTDIEGVSLVDLYCEAEMKPVIKASSKATVLPTWVSDCASLKLNNVLKHITEVSNQDEIKLSLRPNKNGDYQLSLAPFCLTDNQAEPAMTLCNQSSIQMHKAGLFDIDLALNNISMNYLSDFIHPQLTLTGHSHASLKAHWPNGKNKKLTLDINTEQVEGLWHYKGIEDDKTVTKSFHFDFEELFATAQLNDQQANISAAYRSKQLGDVSADIKIKDITNKKRLQGKIRIEELLLSPLAKFDSDIKQTAGKINGSLKLSGTLEQPKLLGSVALTDGLLLTHMVSSRFDNMQLKLDFDLYSAHLQGRVDVDGNPLTTEGKLQWLDEKWQAQVNFKGKDLPLQLAPIKHASISPDIQVNLEPEKLTMSGNIVLNDTLVELKKLPETAYSESNDVIYVHEDNRPNAQTQWQVETDLTLYLQDNVRFKGFGADVTLKGNLNYLQRGSRLPQAQGEIMIDQGKYTFWGQHLNIDNGSFIFSGPLENPDIKIKASRSIDSENLIVGIQGTGPLQEPTFDVFSSKAMDNQTIMHYIITGRAPNKKASEGTDLLSTALLSKGISGAQDSTGSLAESLGIQNFQMSTASGQDGTEVQLSGYIHDKIYINYGMGLFDKANTLTMRYQLMPKLFVETASGLDSTIDLIYSFEID